VLKEAREALARDDVAVLHFRQVYPLPPATADYLRRAQNIIVVENNATSQFGKLIKLHTGIAIENKILKYNGLPFSVEEVLGRLETV
jgi:2-oxoglutarate ferredoxin oxidoreductase subunit alpha